MNKIGLIETYNCEECGHPKIVHGSRGCLLDDRHEFCECDKTHKRIDTPPMYLIRGRFKW